MCVCTYVRTYVRMYVCMYVCMYVRMYVCVYIYIYIYTYIHTYIHVYIYIYIHMYIYKQTCFSSVAFHAPLETNQDYRRYGQVGVLMMRATCTSRNYVQNPPKRIPREVVLGQRYGPLIQASNGIHVCMHTHIQGDAKTSA